MVVPPRQRGLVLVVSLVFLLVLTMIGVTAVQTTTLQDRMAANLRDTQAAFQAAEAALREAESQLGGAVLPAHAYHFEHRPGPDWTAAATWAADGTRVQAYAGASFTEGDQALAANPRYFIEELRPHPFAGDSLEAGVPLDEAVMVRIVARGVGSSTDTEVVLESRYMR